MTVEARAVTELNDPIPPEEWHPHYRTLFEHSAAKPDAVEDHPWDHTVFKVRGKLFVILSAPDRGDMTVKAHPDELEALLGLPYIERAPYVGRYGWVRVTMPDDEALEHALELIDTSYELIARRGKARR